jgi:ribulose-5-phosphate 4-epimerase/fuculose-1-phosphate aldolase
VADGDAVRAAIIDTVGRMRQEGLVVGTAGNVSGRESGASKFWITPSGVDYATVRTDNLVQVDLDGRTLVGSLKPSSDTTTHGAIYRARKDVAGIVHTHSPYATVFAVLRRPIPPLLIEAAGFLGGSVSVADYAPPLSPGSADRVVQGMGSGRAALLPHHGVITVGETVASAFTAAQLVEHAARVAYLASLIGKPSELPSADIEHMSQFLHEEYGQR